MATIFLASKFINILPERSGESVYIINYLRLEIIIFSGIRLYYFTYIYIIIFSGEAAVFLDSTEIILGMDSANERRDVIL